MGISSRPYSVAVLQRLGWAGKVVTATGSGTWRLADAEASGSGVQGVRVKVSKRVSYWLEYHTTDEASEKQPGTFEVKGTPGLQIRLDTGRKSLQILDAAPGNPHDSLFFPDPDLANATLPAGSSFTTPQGVRITLVSQDAGGATVQVQRNKKATAPDAPSITSGAPARRTRTTVTLSVKPGLDNGQVILGYQLQRSPGGASTFVQNPGGTKTSLEVEDGHAGAGSWTVRAVNQVGTSAASAGVAEHVPAPVITSVTPAAGAQVQGPTFPVAVTAVPDPVTGSPVTLGAGLLGRVLLQLPERRSPRRSPSRWTSVGPRPVAARGHGLRRRRQLRPRQGAGDRARGAALGAHRQPRRTAPRSSATAGCSR